MDERYEDVQMDGFNVALFRGADGTMTVVINTQHARDPDDHFGGDRGSSTPRLRVIVNEGARQLDEQGNWVEG